MRVRGPETASAPAPAPAPVLQAESTTQSASSLSARISSIVSSPSPSTSATRGRRQRQSRLRQPVEFARHQAMGGESEDLEARQVDRLTCSRWHPCRGGAPSTDRPAAPARSTSARRRYPAAEAASARSALSTPSAWGELRRFSGMPRVIAALASATCSRADLRSLPPRPPARSLKNGSPNAISSPLVRTPGGNCRSVRSAADRRHHGDGMGARQPGHVAIACKQRVFACAATSRARSAAATAAAGRARRWSPRSGSLADFQPASTGLSSNDTARSRARDRTAGCRRSSPPAAPAPRAACAPCFRDRRRSP